jgi:hypothetical protein
MTTDDLLEKAGLGGHAPVDKDILVKEGVAASTSSGHVEYLPDSPKAERALTAKIDLKVIPVLGLLYLICFLDRTNIANARLGGLEKGLNMPSTGFNTALWVFYIPFVLAEVPLNMLLSISWMKPNLFLGVQTFLLGRPCTCDTAQ